MPEQKLNRLLITGAAGGLGSVLRTTLKPYATILRLSDINSMGTAEADEELMPCDLADKQAVHNIVANCDAIVHLGGVSTDGPWEPILRANIMGVHNLYEAVRKHGVKRVVFASSNHAIGFYRQTERIDADVPLRPDGNYGVSKCFGEDLSRFYFDRYGIETVCMRIGSSFPEPKDRRMLFTWLSYDDLTELVRCALFTPKVGHTIVYGASDNRGAWWDNSKAAHLGWKPKDNSERFRAKIESSTPPLKSDDPALLYQGGVFTAKGPYEN
jgi:uronate dehydrogenase